MNTPAFKRDELAGAQLSDGQEHKLSAVFGLLAAMQNVSVVGQSRTSKTSLLRRLADPQAQRQHGLDPSRFVVCYFDLADPPLTDQQDFWGRVLLEMIRQASGRPALTRMWRARPRGAGFPQFVSYLELAELIGLNVILTLDQFDATSQNRHFDLNFYSALRALASRPCMALVTATRRPLSRMVEASRPVGSSLAGLFVTIRLDRSGVYAGGLSEPPRPRASGRMSAATTRRAAS